MRGDDKPALWASWPASSPYVTAVGATRFIGQHPGSGEMASDQFGSGGGFSSQFDQSNAQWQVHLGNSRSPTARFIRLESRSQAISFH